MAPVPAGARPCVPWLPVPWELILGERGAFVKAFCAMLATAPYGAYETTATIRDIENAGGGSRSAIQAMFRRAKVLGLIDPAYDPRVQSRHRISFVWDLRGFRSRRERQEQLPGVQATPSVQGLTDPPAQTESPQGEPRRLTDQGGAHLKILDPEKDVRTSPPAQILTVAPTTEIAQTDAEAITELEAMAASDNPTMRELARVGLKLAAEAASSPQVTPSAPAAFQVAPALSQGNPRPKRYQIGSTPMVGIETGLMQRQYPLELARLLARAVGDPGNPLTIRCYANGIAAVYAGELDEATFVRWIRQSESARFPSRALSSTIAAAVDAARKKNRPTGHLPEATSAGRE